MKVTIRDISEIKKEIDVVIPVTDVEEDLTAVYEKIGRQAKIKGFRAGKIPRTVLEQHYRADAESEAIRNLVQKSYPEVIQEVDLNPVAPPEIRITGFGPAQELTYQATVEIVPEIAVKGYTGLKLEKEKIEVTESEIQENLKGLQERLAQLIPLSEARPAKAQDVLTLNYQAYQENQPLAGFTGKDFLVELGKGYLFPELESGLQGMGVGEKKRIGVTLPPQWTDKNLAGKKIDYEIEVKDLKEKKLPELNDDFAKDLGPFTTLVEVQERIREDLTRTKEQTAKNKLRRTIIEKLGQANPFSIPEGMIQMEQDEMYHRLEENLKAQGLTPEKAGITRIDFDEKNREEAIVQVRGMLLFDAVARQENISVTQEEAEKRIEEMARQAGQSAAHWKQHDRDHRLSERVKAVLREEKALDFVLSQSTIKVIS